MIKGSCDSIQSLADCRMFHSARVIRWLILLFKLSKQGTQTKNQTPIKLLYAALHKDDCIWIQRSIWVSPGWCHRRHSTAAVIWSRRKHHSVETQHPPLQVWPWLFEPEHPKTQILLTNLHTPQSPAFSYSIIANKINQDLQTWKIAKTNQPWIYYAHLIEQRHEWPERRETKKQKTNWKIATVRRKLNWFRPVNDERSLLWK